MSDNSKQDTASIAGFPWQNFIAVALAIVCSSAIGSMVMTWFSGTQFRPFYVLGMAAYILTFSGLGFRRRWKNAQVGKTATPWYRFSVTELLLLFTGLTVAIGFGAKDIAERSRIRHIQQNVASKASEHLGTDGSLSFDSNGEITIMICDRTFNDQRFAYVVDILIEANLQEQVRRVMFGSGARTAGLPASWMGITDRTVGNLLHLKYLQGLFLQGTAITPIGKKRLSGIKSLEHLHL